MRTSVRAPRDPQAVTPATRTALGAGLAALLLPLCLAVPTSVGTAAAASPRSGTYLALSGPTAVVKPGRHALRVRLTAKGKPIRGVAVRFERATSRGWRGAGSVRTNGQGYALGALPLSSTTKLRAVAPRRAVSREMLVRVTRPAASRSRSSARVAGNFRAAALQVALRQVGKPYRYGATGPDSFDCSGLVNYAYRSVGRSVPRTSSQLRSWAVPVSRSAAQPGDLVFSPGHVGIWVSPGRMVDAPNSGGHVSVRKIYARDYTIGRVR